MTTHVGHDLLRARKLLEAGELVAIPTETVYGLAANALDAGAVIRIFEVKNRPHFDPLIVHLASFTEAGKYARSIPDWAKQLAERFMPGPLTVVLPKPDIIPDIVTSGLDTVALRVPSHPVVHALLSQLDFPLAAPSANPFGYVSPVTAQHVYDQLAGKIPYILDGGSATVGLESTIVGEVGGIPTILRLGGTSLEEIHEIIPDIDVQISASNPLSPGQLESHYSPNQQLFFDADDRIGEFNISTVRTIRFRSYAEGIPHEVQWILSPSGDLGEAARNLFSVMRDLDAEGDVVIFAERFPEEGLGRAINDRLQRASINVN
jgi:L-threonylcarbamoyladenylate synthase